VMMGYDFLCFLTAVRQALRALREKKQNADF
jgi:hypothetical protein